MLKLKSVIFEYNDGVDDFLTVTTQSVRNDYMSLEIVNDENIFSASVHAEKEITIIKLTAVFEYIFTPTDRIFLNGYQSWTDSTEHRIDGKMRGLNHLPVNVVKKYEFSQYGDYNFVSYGRNEGEMHGFSYAYVRNHGDYSFLGSLNEDCGFTVIRTRTAQNEIIVKKECSGLKVSSNYDGLKIYMCQGTETEVFDGYFNELGVKPRTDRKIYGYTSWYRHYQNINSDIILSDLESFSTQKHSPDVFQIDDGWQSAVGDWLSPDSSKFPYGMQIIAESIRNSGMTPGLWFSPFICEENSEVFKNHKDWIVKDSSGNYVKGGSNWSGFYALDIYNEEVREYIRKVFDTVINEWGYGLVKLDFLYSACIIARDNKTRGQIMADGIDFLRSCAGDTPILACGVPLASVFGKTEYCRIGCDVGSDWKGKPPVRFAHRERVSTKNSVLNTVFRRQLDGRAFLSDPDVFMLRTELNSMSDYQKHTLAEINSIGGSVLFTSDNVNEYTAEQSEFLTRIMHLREGRITGADVGKDMLGIKVNFRGKNYTRKYHI